VAAAAASRRAPIACETSAVSPPTNTSPIEKSVQSAKVPVETAAIASGPIRPTQNVAAMP
jgi:hypothetical protein